MSNADSVADFHCAVGEPVPEHPSVPTIPVLDLRIALIAEEAAEAGAELHRVRDRLSSGQPVEVEDLAPIAHELADLLYVTYGTFVALGIRADEVFAEVHRANLTKASGPRRSDGKQLKPPDWQPADVLAVLRRHSG